MGIPRFYRWLSERYPLINEQITAEQIPDFDNLYLDMNGIIHNCSHANTGGLCVKDENDVYVEAFKYIARLVHIIKPKRLLYMAIDGCAPRAKMNQQRSRRFRAANDAREAREKAESMGDVVSEAPFDSNCITPGTEFMAKLTAHLQFFICKKIQEDPLWQNIIVILSGPDVPGEGEHKIVDYIRQSKAQPDYHPNLRHCMYGLDADLIMLALASHEPHFALLREEVIFGRQQTESVEKRMFIQKDRFQLLHISLVREYLDLEFCAEAHQYGFPYCLERVIDDFILFCVLVGNDFLPHLPFSEIGDGGLDKFINTYKKHLAQTSSDAPWLTRDCGSIAWDQFDSFLHQYALIENDKMQSIVDAQEFVLGRRKRVGPMDGHVEVMDSCDLLLDHPPNCDLARVQYYEVKFGMDIQKYEGLQQQRVLFRSYLEGLQWVLFYYYRGPDNASWSWYYPYYHAPLIFDLVNYDELKNPNLHFDIGEPFTPFQQLMAVLPSNSKSFLPTCYQWLFDSPSSPILHFYPKNFELDIDGVTVPWGGVTLIPFIDPVDLLNAMGKAEGLGPILSEAEKQRNSFHSAVAFQFDRGVCKSIASSMPDRFNGIQQCTVCAQNFFHPALPQNVTGYFNGVLPTCDLHISGFPVLKSYDLRGTFEGGVKVFQFEARGQSLIVHVAPASPLMPDKKAISWLMSLSCVQIDYPCAHLGKIVAVHTADQRFLATGKTVKNNARDHENLVRQLTTDLRRSGLSVDFREQEKDEFLQPVAEVQPVEWSYLDSMGNTHYHYTKTSEYRLLHLVQPCELPPSSGQRSVAERFPLGTSVICIAQDSDCFGQTGVIDRSGSDANIEATFKKGLTRDEQHELQCQIHRIVQQQHQSLKWYSLSEVATEVGLAEYVLRLLFSSVMMRSPENVREDVGMNLMYESKKDGSAFCLPAFSTKSPSGWCFSDLAVEAVKDYATKYPEFMQALQQRWNGDRDLEATWIFWESKDAGYTFSKMIKYVNGCAFKQLRFVPAKHMALTPATICEIASAVDMVYSRMLSRAVATERIKGHKHLYKAENPGSRPPAELLSQSQDLIIGQRVVYIKPYGLVPCGSQGTLVAVYGIGITQECEVLLDEDNFGATNLHGRVPSMRGMRATSVSFMPLQPMITSNLRSVCDGAIFSDSIPSKSNASQQQPEVDVDIGKTQTTDGDARIIGKGGRWGGQGKGRSNRSAARKGSESDELVPMNGDTESSVTGSKYWEAKFEELLNLGKPIQSQA